VAAVPIASQTRIKENYIIEADDFHSQNSVSDIIAAHLKMMMMSFENY
jgi:hypothetical protein